MPCYTPPPTKEESHASGFFYVGECEAVLCGIFTLSERLGSLPHLLAALDWGEIGVTQEFAEKWWREHKKRDEKRRAFEASQAR